MRIRSLVLILTLLAAAVFVAGCGAEGKEIDSVTSCLKDAKLNVQPSGKKDEKVEQGVFATSELNKGDTQDIVIAVAAKVRKESTIREFEKQNKEFAETLKKGESGKGLEVESGTDGRYVWVVMGNPDRDGFRDAKDCVAT